MRRRPHLKSTQGAEIRARRRHGDCCLRPFMTLRIVHVYSHQLSLLPLEVLVCLLHSRVVASGDTPWRSRLLRRTYACKLWSPPVLHCGRRYQLSLLPRHWSVYYTHGSWCSGTRSGRLVQRRLVQCRELPKRWQWRQQGERSGLAPAALVFRRRCD